MRTGLSIRQIIAVWAAFALVPLNAAESHGTVKFGGLPVPGATVTATREGRTIVAITDQQGDYKFTDLPDGTWAIEIGMAAFAPLKRDVAVAAGAPAEEWDLKLLSLDQIKASATIISRPAAAPSAPAAEATAETPTDKPKDTPPVAPQQQQAPAESNPDTADNLLINGSVNNGASSPFAQLAAFGNNRRGSRGLYNGALFLTVDNSALDARPFSITGQDTPRPSYTHLIGGASFGGPLKIPHLLKNGPNIFVAYQGQRLRNASVLTALMPTLDQREGNVAPGIQVPTSQISQQAQNLLKFYPLPNFTTGGAFNYQIPTVGSQHLDGLQGRFNKPIGRKNQIFGAFGLQSIRSDSTDVFQFLDTTRMLGLTASVGWRQVFTPRIFGNLQYTFSRMSNRINPFFENRRNVSGDAGIAGNLQDARDWGPPSLSFASGIAGLTDAGASFTRNETNAVSYSLFWGRGRHNIQSGIDYRRQEFNALAQQDARGTFGFTGQTQYADFANFLQGVPQTISIAYGNADKYFRASTYNLYVNDDWRVSPELTINGGIRWEYWSPITELYGRLVNLDIAPGFGAVAPVVASNPVGSVTGQHYPDSLIHPDKGGIEPRIALSWRPLAGSSMVIRTGYGVYYNTSAYQNIATQMAQQPPLSKSLSIPNTAPGLNFLSASSAATLNTFAVDPNFRVGYAQTWQFQLQRDLPGALVMTATYLGIKGTRGMQEFLPNTYPIGGVNPCPACPAGYAYLASNGNSTREAGTIQLRRRLHNGLTATLQYTYSKSIDDVSGLGGSTPILTAQSSPAGAAGPGAGGGAGGPGGLTIGGATGAPGPTIRPSIAQNWLDLSAERGLSQFDQRHLLSVQGQYTTGMGVRGGMLLTGWRGALLKEWTIASQVTYGSGFPLTPVYFAAVPGTGVLSALRPDYTGAPLYEAQGRFLNPAAYVAPAPGEWGNAGRDSIIGPGQFTLNGSMSRTFRMGDRYNLDVALNATNALNHVTYPSWNTIFGNTQFGLPMSANAMRSVLTSVRFRF